MASSSSEESQTTWRKFGRLKRNHGDDGRTNIDNDSCNVVKSFCARH